MQVPERAPLADGRVREGVVVEERAREEQVEQQVEQPDERERDEAVAQPVGVLAWLGSGLGLGGGYVPTTVTRLVRCDKRV